MNEIIIKNWDLYQKYYPKEAIGIETAKNHEPLTREAFDSRQEQCQDKPWENEQQVYTHVRKKTGKEWLNFFKAETRRLANAFSM